CRPARRSRAVTHPAATTRTRRTTAPSEERAQRGQARGRFERPVVDAAFFVASCLQCPPPVRRARDREPDYEPARSPTSVPGRSGFVGGLIRCPMKRKTPVAA